LRKPKFAQGQSYVFFLISETEHIFYNTKQHFYSFSKSWHSIPQKKLLNFYKKTLILRYDLSRQKKSVDAFRIF